MSVLSWLDRKLFPPAQRAEWGSSGITVPPRITGYSLAGTVVNQSSVLGLATAGAALKLVSESVGIMPFKVYQGSKPDVTEARDSWQWFRLKEQPNDDQDAFTFWTDAAASIEAYGDAFIWKALVRRPVRGADDIQLYLIDPGRVQVKRDEQNRKYYEVWRRGQRERVASAQILQVRGWASTPGSDRGLSTVSQYANTMGNALAAQEYVGRFYGQGTTIPGIISVPGNPSQDELDSFRDDWVERHGGGQGAFIPAVLGGGATWAPTGITMRDAQYIETQQWSAQEVCRAMRVTPQMLGLDMANSKGADDDIQRFLTVDMHPRYRRLEAGVGRDLDLFPAGSELFPEFLLNAALRPSMQARMAAYKDGRQASVYTIDDVRVLENLPPVPGGGPESILQTPVGGAPNQQTTESNGAVAPERQSS